MPRKSFADYDRPGEAENFESDHFSGSFGDFLRASDEQVLDTLIPDWERSILDVGAGSGRLSIYLARTRDARIVSSDASRSMLQTASSRTGELSNLEFVLADAQDLPFADRSFDYVISFRCLMHLPDWRQGLAEMCRVARKGVLVDVPARFAAPGLEALYHSILNKFGGETEPYRTFGKKSLVQEFRTNGFEISTTERRFVLPVKISRRLPGGKFPIALERGFRRTGVSRVLGGQLLAFALRADDGV